MWSERGGGGEITAVFIINVSTIDIDITVFIVHINIINIDITAVPDRKLDSLSRSRALRPIRPRIGRSAIDLTSSARSI